MSIKRNSCTLYDKGICIANNAKCNYIPKRCTKLNNNNIVGDYEINPQVFEPNILKIIKRSIEDEE